MSGQMPGISFRPVAECLAALSSAAVLEFIYYRKTGSSLDLFLSGIVVAILLNTFLLAFAGRMPGICRNAAAALVGIGCIWLIPVYSDVIDVRQWMLCVAVLASVMASGVSLIILLHTVGCSHVATGAITTTTALLWLSWPVWLSPSLPGNKLHWSVAIHPFFAMNKVVANLGIWTEQQGAYGLTTLGQDVQYQMPASPWPAILFHLAIAVLYIFISNVKKISHRLSTGGER